MFTGTYTAIVTPFRRGVLDERALERLIKAQIKGGVDGIVPVGTTGESPTLDYEEHVRVIELAVQFASGKIKVLAGTGGNSTSEAIYLTKAAEEAGADREVLDQVLHLEDDPGAAILGRSQISSGDDVTHRITAPPSPPAGSRQ